MNQLIMILAGAYLALLLLAGVGHLGEATNQVGVVAATAAAALIFLWLAARNMQTNRHCQRLEADLAARNMRRLQSKEENLNRKLLIIKEQKEQARPGSRAPKDPTKK